MFLKFFSLKKMSNFFFPMAEEETKQIFNGDSAVGRDAFFLAWYRAFQRARWVPGLALSPPQLMCITPQ